ncbi:hypothetical protein DFH06DRAFT_1127915 [Mycena polygramma]|nr:hypothetical protein DFH06DRAFT_1127915 [Mycena polygramma]
MRLVNAPHADRTSPSRTGHSWGSVAANGARFAMVTGRWSLPQMATLSESSSRTCTAGKKSSDLISVGSRVFAAEETRVTEASTDALSQYHMDTTAGVSSSGDASLNAWMDCARTRCSLTPARTLGAQTGAYGLVEGELAYPARTSDYRHSQAGQDIHARALCSRRGGTIASRSWTTSVSGNSGPPHLLAYFHQTPARRRRHIYNPMPEAPLPPEGKGGGRLKEGDLGRHIQGRTDSRRLRVNEAGAGDGGGWRGARRTPGILGADTTKAGGRGRRMDCGTDLAPQQRASTTAYVDYEEVRPVVSGHGGVRATEVGRECILAPVIN